MTEQEAFRAWCKANMLTPTPSRLETWKAALDWARTQQEPVATVRQKSGSTGYFVHFEKTVNVGDKLYTHPAPAQPVRLSDEDIHTAWNIAHEKTMSDDHYDPEKFDLNFANAIQDAMLAKGAAKAVVEKHPDDEAVDRFADAMKEKLAKARAKGRAGWEGMSAGELSAMLYEHVEKGDPRDVANFCMFLWNNGSGIVKCQPTVVQSALLKQALEVCEVFEKLFTQAEENHKGLMDDGQVVDCAILVRDLRKGLYAASDLRKQEEPAVVQQEWNLDQEQAKFLVDYILADPDEPTAITLSVGFVKDDDGGLSHGLRLIDTEYPEEGAVILVESAPNEKQPGLVQQVLDEVTKATLKFPTWPTDPLHAVAVLGEEFGELTKAVLQHTYEPYKATSDDVRMEAIQTAAMALRFLMSLDKYQFSKCEQHEQAALKAAKGE